jgi:hypothetical protein
MTLLSKLCDKSFSRVAVDHQHALLVLLGLQASVTWSSLGLWHDHCLSFARMGLPNWAFATMVANPARFCCAMCTCTVCGSGS